MEDYCLRLPKVELHAHLTGSLSRETIDRLVQLGIDQSSSGCQKLSEHERNSLVLDSPKSMGEVFKIFPLIQSLTQTWDAVCLATSDVISDFSKDGVAYLELRSTPKKTTSMTKEQYVGAIVAAISANQLPIVTRLILSVDRKQTVEEALHTVEIAISDTSGFIVGVELSGNPALDGRQFLPVFEKARSVGMRVAIHLAEVPENLDEVDDFLTFTPDRIGHGTFLHLNKGHEQVVREKNIPLEICLSSNVFSKTTPSVSDSHIRHWMQLNHPISINTDDKGMMGQCSLSSEYQLAADSIDLSEQKLKEIALSSLEDSFLDHSSIEYENLHRLISDFR